MFHISYFCLHLFIFHTHTSLINSLPLYLLFCSLGIKNVPLWSICSITSHVFYPFFPLDEYQIPIVVVETRSKTKVNLESEMSLWMYIHWKMRLTFKLGRHFRKNSARLWFQLNQSFPDSRKLRIRLIAVLSNISRVMLMCSSIILLSV